MPRRPDAPALRFAWAIFSVSSGTTTAGSMAARSSRKVPHPALRKSFVIPSEKSAGATSHASAMAEQKAAGSEPVSSMISLPMSGAYRPWMSS